MQFLPSLKRGRSAGRLPLASASAAALAEALLTDDAAHRRDLLSDSLALDPALALWTACYLDLQQGAGPRDAPPTVADLARGLSGDLLGALSSLGQTSRPHASDPERIEGWASLLAPGVFAAGVAAALAELSEDVQGEQAYLCGLLHGAIEWLSTPGRTVSQEACLAGKTCLPAWLIARLVPKDAAAQEEPLSIVVAQATAAAAGEQEPPALRRKQIEACRTRAGEARQRWVFDVPGAGRCLPELVGRLTRLAKLEADYHQELLHEKLASLRELTYGASHEINNPLANISARAQSMLREETDPERRRKLATIYDQAMRGHEMISQMALFARPPKPVFEPVDLVGLIEPLLPELTDQAKEHGVTMRQTAGNGPLVISADPTQLIVAVRAMLVNAIEAMPRGGDVEIEARPQTGVQQNGHSGEEVCVIVRDTGSGLTDRERRHLFDPFFSGREAGRGLGFGLSKCWQIVDAHGGRIEVASEPDQGTTLTVWLPVAREE